MRPLKLKFRGLRSYRGELEIDFTDVNLMAIIGDTGAGKSSILEALFFALYGGSSWDHSSGKGLIAAGGDGNLAVELTFQAGGQTWQVQRTASITGHPAAVHHLTGLDGGPEVDGFRQVNQKIRDVVGLEPKTFLRAVVLPQGRFQELLHTKKSERPGVLKNILGLDELATMREQVDAARERIEPQLTALIEQRGTLLPDPEGVLAESKRRLADLHTQVKVLDDAKQAITTARADEAAAMTHAKKCQTVGTALAAQVPDNVTEQYQNLVTHDARLAQELAAIDQRISEATQREAVLRGQLDTAEGDGTGVRDTAAALTTIGNLLNQLPSIQQEHNRISEERGAIAIAQEELARDEKTLAELNQAKKTTNERFGAAAKLLERRQILLTDFQEATQDWSGKVEVAAKALAACELLEGELEEANGKDEEARGAVEEVTELLATAERADAAAHAALTCLPGQQCPICTQTLPEDFTPPVSDGIAEAQAALASAKKHEKATAEKLLFVSQRYSAAQAVSETSSKAVVMAAGARTAARKAAQDEFDSLVPGLDDPENLAHLTAAVDAATTEVSKLKETAQQAQDSAVAAEARLDTIQQELKRRQDALAESAEALEGRRRDMRATYDKLPTMYRLENHPAVSSLSDAKHLAEQRDIELTKLTKNLGEAQQDLNEVRQVRVVVERRRNNEVAKAAEKVREPLIRAMTRSLDAADITGLSSAPTFPDTPDIVEEARWAAEVACRSGDLVEACDAEASRQTELAKTARDQVTTALRTADVVDETELEKRQEALVGATAVARSQHDTASSELPLSTELDKRIACVRPVMDALRELDRLLAPGKFPAAVVRRRQQALLGAASDLLGSMTGDRFSFAEDFQIVDNELGQPRDVRTLSGGETFLASLALALALIELTSRGGARVEALFLDEGFGTLDANALDDALDALARQAGEDRLVAVISHLRSVAANVNDILLVTKNFSGSTARWLTAEERDQIIIAEIDRGLLE